MEAYICWYGADMLLPKCHKFFFGFFRRSSARAAAWGEAEPKSAVSQNRGSGLSGFQAETQPAGSLNAVNRGSSAQGQT